MEAWIQRIFLIALPWALLAPAHAQDEQPEGGSRSVLDQIITPDMERRVIEEDALDRENFELGLYTGVLSVEDFGSNDVTGIRFAYHVTEGFFLEAVLAQSTLRETSFERLSGSAPLLTDEQRELTYYNLSIGYNIFPGEVFIGKNWAFNTSLYVIAGAGNTSFADEEHFTYNFGGGLRFFLTDWIALHVDMRDHIFSHDLLGEELTTHNLEAHMGFTLFF
ncbi:MAG: outer membrane beta-barrel domain-containing protein [Cellvibrionaceae bacterium]